MQQSFIQFLPIKFMIVMGKMYKSIFKDMDKHLKELGINESEFLVLFSLAANGPLTIQDIGERMFVTSGSMTYTIDKLEKKAWIERKVCTEDRRKIYIALTQEGEVNWEKLIEAHMKYLEHHFSNINETEINQAIDIMKHIGKTLERNE